MELDGVTQQGRLRKTFVMEYIKNVDMCVFLVQKKQLISSLTQSFLSFQSV